MNVKIRYGLLVVVLVLIVVGVFVFDIFDQFLDEKEGNYIMVYCDGFGIWIICCGVIMVDGKFVILGMRLLKEKCDQVNVIECDKVLVWVECNIKVLLIELQKVGIVLFCFYNIGFGKCFLLMFYKWLNVGDCKGVCEVICWWIKDGGCDCCICLNNCYGQVICCDQESVLVCWGIDQ